MEESTQVNVELFKTHVDKFLKGREIQWKLIIYFWAAIGAVTSLLYGKVFPSTKEIWLVSTIVPLLFFIFWVFPISKSIKTDRALYSKYRANLEKIANEDDTATVHKIPFYPDFLDLSKLIITFLLVSTCCYLLSNAPIDTQIGAKNAPQETTEMSQDGSPN